MKPGTLYVVPVLNSMGPVIDPKHDDLLESWEEIDAALMRACTKDYRRRYTDDAGQPLKFSFFCISWSGFKSNPVQRKFGWHTIFDHYRRDLKDELSPWGDAFYWMYNHPPESGVGNEWGLDWLHNSHYYDILARFLVDRAYWPSCVECPTERNDASHVFEEWIPFDFGNRNSPANVLDSVNADGKVTGSVIDWRRAPHDWSHYNPHPGDYQIRGELQRTVFRIVDIKSIVHVLTPEQIARAFDRALEGKDTVLCAYEHDFRDRFETVMELMIEPVFAMRAERYPDVELRFATALEAARAVLGLTAGSPPRLELTAHDEGLRIAADRRLYGRGPFVAVHDEENGKYFHLPLARLGQNIWRFPDIALPARAVIAAGAHDLSGNVCAMRWRVENGTIGEAIAPDVMLGDAD